LILSSLLLASRSPQTERQLELRKMHIQVLESRLKQVSRPSRFYFGKCGSARRVLSLFPRQTEEDKHLRMKEIEELRKERAALRLQLHNAQVRWGVVGLWCGLDFSPLLPLMIGRRSPDVSLCLRVSLDFSHFASPVLHIRINATPPSAPYITKKTHVFLG
jgi:hypothetical protein